MLPKKSSIPHHICEENKPYSTLVASSTIRWVMANNFLLGSTVEVFTNSENTLTGIMFQDGIMKSVFSAYPELLLVDATYKLNDLRMPVYLMMSIDGNGHGEIVLVFLTQLETEEALSRMVQAFKGGGT